MTTGLSFLFVGAHHDDVEIAAGGTIAKLVGSGHRVAVCVLTDEQDPVVAGARRAETRKAASCLGVPPDKVMFVGLQDGYLQALPGAVACLRDVLKAGDINPDVVVTHSPNESHQDHRHANELVQTAFRQKVILMFAVVNHLVISGFSPEFVVDIASSKAMKDSAIKAHSSQEEKGRILWDAITSLDKRYGTYAGSAFAEAFEIVVQHGGEQIVHSLSELNDSGFHLLWRLLLGNTETPLIHGVPVRRHRQQYQWKTDKDREGIQRLSEAFRKMWFSKTPFWESSSEAAGVERVLERGPVILSGGPVSNVITRDYLMRIPSLRYVIEYDMPDWENIRIVDRLRHREIRAEYKKRNLTTDVDVDFGLLTIMRNPFAPKHHLIGCMGIHGFGSLACFEYLSDSRRCAELMGVCRLPLADNTLGYQVIIRADIRNERYGILKDKLHVMTTTDKEGA